MINDAVILNSKSVLKYRDLLQSLHAPIYMTIGSLLNSDKPRQILYHIINDISAIPICQCGVALNWVHKNNKYQVYCSKNCTDVFSSAKKRITLLNKTIDQKADSIRKRQATCFDNHGVYEPLQCSDILLKKKNTCLAKYQVDHPFKADAVKSKIKKSMTDLHGVAYPLQSSDILLKKKNTCLDKYGKEHSSQAAEIKNKTKITCISRYGLPHAVTQSSKEKSIKTCLARYGVTHPMLNKTVQYEKQEHWFTKEVADKLNDPSWLRTQHNTLTLSEIAASLKCNESTLGNYFRRHNITILSHQTTIFERKLLDYFQAIGFVVELHNRVVIAPKEIDIYFPDFKFGIEINGLYWHSTEFKSKSDHLEKTEACLKQGIELWHFTDNELQLKWDLIISKISHRLGITGKRIYARKLNIRIVSPKDKTQFLTDNHLQGDCPSKVNIGLYNEDTLIMVSTFGKSRYDKNVDWELIRMAALKGHTVVGGPSRLLKVFMTRYMKSAESIISYCQRKFSVGSVYYRLGFLLTHVTPPGYTYVQNGLPVGDRTAWQKHKLKDKLQIFDPTITEVENMKINNYYQFWDCGQLVFKLSKPIDTLDCFVYN